jgi:hypothetical protein
MNFKQLRKIRAIRMASMGQLFGLLLILTAAIGSAEFRLEADTEFSILGEQIIGYAEARQHGVGDLMIQQFDKVLPVEKRVQVVIISSKAGTAASSISPARGWFTLLLSHLHG